MFTDGELWKEQRRFSVRHLRELGMGRSSQEDYIMDEVNDLISSLEVKTILFFIIKNDMKIKI